MSGICRKSDFFECHLSVTLWKIFAPLFVIIGVPGNIVSLVVLSRRPMRQTTTSVYFRLLAIIDTAVLLITIPRKITFYYSSLRLRSLNIFTCKFYSFLTPALTTLSWTFLPVITIDRYIQIRYPIWAKTHSTSRSALTIFAVMTLTVFTLNFHTVLFLTVPRTEVTVSNNYTNTTFEVIGKCTPIYEWYNDFYYNVWTWLIFALFNLVPLTVQIIGNVLLIKNLVNRSKQKQTQRALDEVNMKERRGLKSVTRMLIVVCLFYIISSVPQCTRLVSKNYIFQPRSPHNSAKDKLFQAIVQILLYSNNAINFLLYTLSGRVFRQELYSMLRSIKRRVQHRFGRNNVYPVETTSVHQENSTTVPKENYSKETNTTQVVNSIAGKVLDIGVLPGDCTTQTK